MKKLIIIIKFYQDGKQKGHFTYYRDVDDKIFELVNYKKNSKEEWKLEKIYGFDFLKKEFEKEQPTFLIYAHTKTVENNLDLNKFIDELRKKYNNYLILILLHQNEDQKLSQQTNIFKLTFSGNEGIVNGLNISVKTLLKGLITKDGQGKKELNKLINEILKYLDLKNNLFKTFLEYYILKQTEKYIKSAHSKQSDTEFKNFIDETKLNEKINELEKNSNSYDELKKLFEQYDKYKDLLDMLEKLF